ncbi:hypothetical protein HK098_005070 [Nowakowskiella sp. JEL0407]|nr:hypothetical protein HK098_005070 [Nowakowskiella sp. JEL0407]
MTLFTSLLSPSPLSAIPHSPPTNSFEKGMGALVSNLIGNVGYDLFEGDEFLNFKTPEHTYESPFDSALFGTYSPSKIESYHDESTAAPPNVVDDSNDVENVEVTSNFALTEEVNSGLETAAVNESKKRKAEGHPAASEQISVSIDWKKSKINPMDSPIDPIARTLTASPQSTPLDLAQQSLLPLDTQQIQSLSPFIRELTYSANNSSSPSIFSFETSSSLNFDPLLEFNNSTFSPDPLLIEFHDPSTESILGTFMNSINTTDFLDFQNLSSDLQPLEFNDNMLMLNYDFPEQIQPIDSIGLDNLLLSLNNSSVLNEQIFHQQQYLQQQQQQQQHTFHLPQPQFLQPLPKMGTGNLLKPPILKSHSVTTSGPIVGTYAHATNNDGNLARQSQGFADQSQNFSNQTLQPAPTMKPSIPTQPMIIQQTPPPGGLIRPPILASQNGIVRAPNQMNVTYAMQHTIPSHPNTPPQHVHLSPQHSNTQSITVVSSPPGMPSPQNQRVVNVNVNPNMNQLSPPLSMQVSPQQPQLVQMVQQPPSQQQQQPIFQCTFAGCGKSFAHFTMLQTHQQTHGKAKPFSCEICPQTFSRSHDLKRHYYIHTQEKPFTCPKCGKGFSRRDALKRHEKSVLEGKKVVCGKSEDDSQT